MDSKKIIAAAVVALFCVTAYACVVSDDSDAASKKYELYVEVLGNDHIVSDYVYVYFESDADNEKYCKAANEALAKAGFADVTLEVGDYGISFKYKGDGNNSCWYSDGKDWVSVSKGEEDYIKNTKAGVAVNGGWIDQATYDALPEYEKVNWLEDAYMGGYYQKILEVPGTVGEIKNYMVFLTIINDNLVDIEAQTISFSSENNVFAWVSAFNQATKALGNSIFAQVNASYAMGYVSISYGENGNTACWVKENSKWVSVSDPTKQYPASSEIDFELKNGWISSDKYNGLSDSEKKFWQSDAMMPGWYERIATGELVDDVLNVMLIVGIVIIVIIVILVVFLIFRSKKKSSA